MHQIISTRSG